MRLRLAALLVGITFVVVACSGGGGGDGGAVQSAGGGNLPDTEFELLDGTTATVAEILDDRPLVLNFFASWCAPCVAEMPEFQEVFADVGSDVAFFGIALQDTRGAAEELVEQTGIAYPWGLDDGELYAQFGGFAMPTTVFITADGKVAGENSGQINADKLRSQIRDLLGVAA
jgi:cytochrome c biogenesis protein CcmG/thiol:disulfide interchange protein DsbE